MTAEEYKITIKGKRVGVLGLGVSNMPLVDFLLSAGAVVTARDKKDEAFALSKYEDLEKKGVRIVCGDGYLDGLDDEIIFRSPGIRPDTPQIAKAVANGAVLTSEMELFFDLCPCNIIAITGSDGKTTTTTITSELLRAEGKTVYIGGNIGTPLLPLVHLMKEDDYAVVELSSFQLQTMKKSPSRCIITNITPNHLNWHTGMDEYALAKHNVFLHQDDNGYLVTNYLCDSVKNLRSKGKTALFSSNGKPDTKTGVYLKDGYITYYDESGEYPVLNTEDIILPGRHNVENYMAAYCVTHDIVSAETLKKVATTFGGVKHRCEFVREYEGVKYYNSSIDSSPTRTIAALSSFKEKVVVILGGYDKNIPYEPLVPHLFEHAHTAVLTGATAEKIYSAITQNENFEVSKLKIFKEPDFKSAVYRAKAAANSGDNVILSPAAASFDAFENFEVRGDTFKAIVNGFGKDDE